MKNCRFTMVVFARIEFTPLGDCVHGLWQRSVDEGTSSLDADSGGAVEMVEIRETDEQSRHGVKL
jgi:hypothetical protein